MTLKGREIIFRLSPDGQVALREVFPAAVAFSAQVVEEDPLGVWVLTETPESWNPEEPVRVALLKWEYFSTAELDVEPEVPDLSLRVGFR